MQNKYTKNKKGFTLVEMLVSIAVFMSVMTVAVTSLVSIINVNRKTQDIKSVVDNVTFVVDSISRNTRIGTNYSCSTDPVGGTYIGDCAGGGQYFQYKKSDSEYVQYRFIASPVAEGNIQKRICPDNTNTNCPTDPNSPNSWKSMTAPTDIVNITNMTFYVFGVNNQHDSGEDRTQPRVIITVEGVVKESNQTETKFTLQTTSSQRSRRSI